MVFHQIENHDDVYVLQRIILYLIEGNLVDTDQSGRELCNIVEDLMGKLQKKNDDLLMFKVLQNSEQFNKFEELYAPEVSGFVTLFVVNKLGIPMVCEHINEVKHIHHAIKSITDTCKLNGIPTAEIPKTYFSETVSVASSGLNLIETSESEDPNTGMDFSHELCKPTNMNLIETSESEVSNTNFAHESYKPTNIQTPTQNGIALGESQPTPLAELQICLPDGRRNKHKFEKVAKLQEIWVFISVTYNLKDFCLKTYNRLSFSEIEYEMTLSELDLYPNGVLYVVLKNISPLNNNGGLMGMLQYGIRQLARKTTSILGFMQGLLFMFWNSLFFSGNGGEKKPQNRIRSQEESAHQSTSSRGSNKFPSRAFGNIHTLRRNEDSDDENNRYNGNSTQQK